MRVGAGSAVVVAFFLSLGTRNVRAQASQSAGGDVENSHPFAVGERLTYAVRVGPLGRGSAVAEIRKIDTLRGIPVYHSIFTIDGSLLFFSVRDQYESWFDP